MKVLQLRWSDEWNWRTVGRCAPDCEDLEELVHARIEHALNRNFGNVPAAEFRIQEVPDEQA